MTGHEPERLRVLGANELERTLLAAAGAELPDPELRARMAGALGLAGLTAAATATRAPGSALAWPVISASVAALALTGAAIGYASHRPQRPAPAPAVAQPAPRPAPEPATMPAAMPRETALIAPAAPRRRRTAAAAPATDLRAEIALLDAARAAVADRAGDRALVLLHRYETRFPAGTFAPESAALRIEALARLGRMREARGLGAEFLATHPDSPLAARVQRVLSGPSPP